MSHYLLAIDQGTTNSRAIIFNRNGDMLGSHEIALSQSFPHDGWVEQDAEEMANNTIRCCQEVVKKLNISPSDIAGIGISNQRETTIVWDAHTGKPIYPAIVWQDRRTSDICERLSKQEIGKHIQEKTGLRLDPYFSGTKIMWLLEHVSGARERAERGELLFGTVDTYLLWKLTGGKSHLTDASNASRTLLFNIRTQQWDADLLSALQIPASLLPTVMDNAADFGVLEKNIVGVEIPIAGMAGDQQAATIGQACFQSGMIKTTLGTGCFMLLNTGSEIIQSKNQLLSTVAYRLNNKVTYGLEGSIFCAGATVKWLRDTLELIKTAVETESLAKSVVDTGGVYLVPAFTGLGAPYWDPHARGAILGLTRNSSLAQVVRAALESVAYQARDLLGAMTSDSQSHMSTMRADGGMTANNWLLQFLADTLNLEVQRPACIETSALGAAYLAGLQVGMYQSLDDIANCWQMNARFKPTMPASQREKLYSGWKAAVTRVIS
jgi:glycerol kinase